MKIRTTFVHTSFNKIIATVTILLSLMGCAGISDIVPQLPTPQSSNSGLPAGQDIARANAFLQAGKKREAADAYFRASQNYRSPEQERLILQAAELSSLFNDASLTQKYLAPLNFDRLSLENQSRFRMIQAQLGLNDGNYREALRILPQRIQGIPDELGQKILTTRMSAAQSSGDKLALVQELVLQESYLKQPHEVSLNHDRIWNHSMQIPALQLNQATSSISHPVLKNWLTLSQLARLSKNGPWSKKQSLRSDIASWIQRNPTHPGQNKAILLLSSKPVASVTPYIQTPVVKRPVIKNTVVKKPVVKRPVIKSPVVQKPIVKTPIKKDPSVGLLYEEIKKQIKK